jgi:hypothetical protein
LILDRELEHVVLVSSRAEAAAYLVASEPQVVEISEGEAWPGVGDAIRRVQSLIHQMLAKGFLVHGVSYSDG